VYAPPQKRVATLPQYDRDVPADVKVKGNLVLQYRPRLRSIGDGLTVTGDLTVGGGYGRFEFEYEKARIPIKALPHRLSVGGSLALRSCFRLETFPADAVVGGSVTLQDCDALRSLPDEWVVNGSLTIIGGESLTELPWRLHVAGDFRLAGTKVTRLPDDLLVGGSLVVYGRSLVATIPEGVQVHGDIVFRHCPIESVPDGLTVRKTLRLPGSRRLKRVPPGLSVPEKLDLADCTAVEEIPAGLRVGHSLKLRGCTSLRSLPEGLQVPYTLDLRGCTALTALPRGMRVGLAFRDRARPVGRTRTAGFAGAIVPALRLADCTRLTELPDDIEVGGPIEVAGSALRELPASLAGAQVMWRGVLVPPDVVFHPERLAALDILRQPNAELRRVMLERVGLERVLADAGALRRDDDTDPGGERRLVYVPVLNHCYLVCQCPSTARRYLLRVPPGTQTCRAAAAWMAGYSDPERYKPIVET
jgi:hypothetical protein